ncbi:TetR/AcrR family transcriptional regulator [Streptococcus dentapri]|uniref:TetR/AcrR family transcriptional regulator n=1 Tax=Streptococcus dentapri TaxID=573564 RepID=A0ABV8D2X1_9STRE
MVSDKVEGTKQRIIRAAQSLFAEKSYQAVGVREIAKRAGCSHTAIYLYFKNKDEILYEVAHEPLEGLYQNSLNINQSKLPPADKLLQICHSFIAFGFQHINAYHLLFIYGGDRVDLPAFANPVNTLRIDSFNILRDLIKQVLPDYMNDEQALNIVRGVYFFLLGTISTYATEGGVYDERLQAIVTDYLTYSILQKEG